MCRSSPRRVRGGSQKPRLLQNRAVKLRRQRIRREHRDGHAEQVFGVNLESRKRQQAGRPCRINQQIKVALFCVGAVQNRSEDAGATGHDGLQAGAARCGALPGLRMVSSRHSNTTVPGTANPERLNSATEGAVRHRSSRKDQYRFTLGKRDVSLPRVIPRLNPEGNCSIAIRILLSVTNLPSSSSAYEGNHL